MDCCYELFFHSTSAFPFYFSFIFTIMVIKDIAFRRNLGVAIDTIVGDDNDSTLHITGKCTQINCYFFFLAFSLMGTWFVINLFLFL